jgi:predicted nucleotidyltransferase component of viral defense system
MFDSDYESQARLMLRCLNKLERYPCFALKGGTAINMFVRDLPRLSVDIDLTYLPVQDRDASFREINDTLLSLKSDIERTLPASRVQTSKIQGYVIRLLVYENSVVVKIEPNLILRGTVYPPQSGDLCIAAQKHFQMFVRAQHVSFADLYAGKICAALDRQHPRDLFDIRMLLANEGLTDEIRKAFVVYLVSHSRPIVELLDPNFLDLKPFYQEEFAGMVREDVSLVELTNTRKILVQTIRQTLTEGERRFILSVKRMSPEWELLGLPGIETLPAIQWKLMNLRKMTPAKHQAALKKLERFLESSH